MEQKSSGSLNIDNNTLETGFSKILMKLINSINSSNLTDQQQNEGAKIIKAFAAESALSKQPIRNENTSSRKSDGFFLIHRSLSTRTDPICQKFCKQLSQ